MLIEQEVSYFLWLGVGVRPQRRKEHDINAYII